MGNSSSSNSKGYDGANDLFFLNSRYTQTPNGTEGTGISITTTTASEQVSNDIESPRKSSLKHSIYAISSEQGPLLPSSSSSSSLADDTNISQNSESRKRPYAGYKIEIQSKETTNDAKQSKDELKISKSLPLLTRRLKSFPSTTRTSYTRRKQLSSSNIEFLRPLSTCQNSNDHIEDHVRQYSSSPNMFKRSSKSSFQQHRRCKSNTEFRSTTNPLHELEHIEQAATNKLLTLRTVQRKADHTISLDNSCVNTTTTTTTSDGSKPTSTTSTCHDKQCTSNTQQSNKMTNEYRNCHRAESYQTVVDDLCNIVSEMYISEKNLLKETNSGASSIDAVHKNNRGQREQVVTTIQSFLSDLPMRYALGVQTPSEVLVHMRLMAVARSDMFRAAVHIVSLEGQDATKNGMRMVTISCSDRYGLLEYMTKILASGGARVLDADVMTTPDNIVLDRFVVQMKGRLRLDRFQHYIEDYLRKNRDPPDSDFLSYQQSSSEETIPPNPILDAPPSNISPCDLRLPLYISPREAMPPRKESILQEVQEAKPLSEIMNEASTVDLKSKMSRSVSFSGRLLKQQQLPMNLRSRSSTDRNIPTSLRPSSLPIQSSGCDSVERHEVRQYHQETEPIMRFQNNVEPSDSSRDDRHSVARRGSRSIRYSANSPGLLDSLLQAQPSQMTNIPFEELKLLGVIGDGRVSTIYRAVWQKKDDTCLKEIALKVATMGENGDDSELQELRQEADIASSLEHYNVCDFVGAAVDSDCFCLAYDYCQNGSLSSLLSDTSRCYDYLPIAIDIANGMAYLHSKKIIHRDLKPSNILLTKENRAKICDFGMSLYYRGQELTAETGTYRWMAPEVIRHETYSSNADVYSFGVVLWQLITREIPFATLTPIQTAYAVAEGHRPDIPSSTPKRLRQIITDCWNADSGKRPSFTYITMALADYAKMAFDPANVGSHTVQIANSVLANVPGNSTVNVDFSAPMGTTPPASTSSYMRERFSSNQGYGSYSSNIGLPI